MLHILRLTNSHTRNTKKNGHFHKIYLANAIIVEHSTTFVLVLYDYEWWNGGMICHIVFDLPSKDVD